MSKHIGRKQRWTQVHSGRYSSDLGKVLYQEKAWYAVFAYRTRVPTEESSSFPTWLAQSARLGPFKRPRNAMIALEREVTFLKNRHGDDILLNDQTWAETGNP